ncbi:type VII secretion protein EccE [Mycobacteroides abscessus subsp. abscessus]|uniref:type VII secretion protein EccE n=1 Tax=Mycobacteroides abscessus TaxID=36809 RepID=UPI000926523C|nr:type VII secretion protein EccE [Mycobacteroides abscessus]SIH21827.1 type VII secretion protein EccE [Mycobacteroides abscessus subsp. abscessus]
MSNLRLASGQGNIHFAVLTGITVYALTSFLKLTGPVAYAAYAAAAILALTAGFITYRGRTFAGWIHERGTYKNTKRRRGSLKPHEDKGITWDERRAAAYLEVLPNPYEITVIGSNGPAAIRRLPVDTIREEIDQFDIHCDSVDIVTTGYKYVRSSQLATAYHSSTGAVAALLWGRTFIRVAVAMDENSLDSLDSIYARQFDDGPEAGLHRTVSVATERIHRRLAEKGWIARPLNTRALAALDAQSRKYLQPALDEEHWAAAGPRSMQVASFTPTAAAWNTKNYQKWCTVDTYRQFQILRLRRGRAGDHAEMFVGYVTADTSTLDNVTALGLAREYGQQGDIITAALPLNRTDETSAIAGKYLGDDAFPIELHSGGVGVNVGQTRSKELVFVNFAGDGTELVAQEGGKDPVLHFLAFYVVGPAAMCQQLLLRLATSGKSININLPGQAWQVFASRIGATYGPENLDSDINVADSDHPESSPGNRILPKRPDQHLIVWPKNKPGIEPRYGIIAGPAESTVRTRGQQVKYFWPPIASAEANFLTILPNQGRHSAPAPTA